MESYQTTITVLVSAASAIFALVCREGVAALLKWKADRRIDTAYEDEKLKSGYEKLIANQEKRISNLETVLLQSQADHLKCEQVQAGLKVQVDYQQEDIARQQQEINHQQVEIDQQRSKIEQQQEEINTLRERLDKTP